VLVFQGSHYYLGVVSACLGLLLATVGQKMFMEATVSHLIEDMEFRLKATGSRFNWVFAVPELI